MDIDFNYYGKKRSEAEALYRYYIWEDRTDFVNKDIVRILSVPGFVTGYMIGEMEITRLRDLAKKELGWRFLGEGFSLRSLASREYPLPYLEEHIRAYIACKKDPTREDCKEFL